MIIFDEVQFYPKARQAIKHLVKDGRYDYIETGSLISIKESVEDILILSQEDKLKMYPLDFEEFLWATGNELLSDYIKDCFDKKIPLMDAFYKKASYAFNEYILVGGMSQSVIAYVKNSKDFFKAHESKLKILCLYKDDIKKSNHKYQSKVSVIFDNIPGYLSSGSKQISLRNIKDGQVYSAYSEPLYWLEDSMICNLCYKCTDPNVGLSLYKDTSSIKCYMADTGLLVSMVLSNNQIEPMLLYKQIMNGKLASNKGMLFENVIAQTLAAKNIDLYFYTQYSEEKKRNDIEIDFMVTDKANKLIPVEVKSSKNYTTISYNKFKEKFNKRIGESYIIHQKAFSKDETGYKIPAYMAYYLFDNK